MQGPTPHRRDALLGLAAAGASVAVHSTVWANQSAPALRPTALAPALANAVEPAILSDVRINGWLGRRIQVNAAGRLLNVDIAPFLAGYQTKPGSHPWIGEHVGKWLHAATLAWAHGGDPLLRAKLDRAVGDLIAAQEPDGYLGTYLPGMRFGLYPGADWDVWSHKYCLIGLLTYHRYTGELGALQCAMRAADLLIATFPAHRSILAAGTHLGMAATSVLEPIVLLYTVTGEERYLRFARYIVQSWDEPGGPAIITSLLAGKPVNEVANAKAYEMLSNLVGLVEFGRVTGEQAPLIAARNAWRDIVNNRLFLTGTVSQWEHFQSERDWRDDALAHLGETCVTTTWIQFNLGLFLLTGEACFANELERTTYNHLTAAQHPSGEDWCYFTPLKGRKSYLSEVTCCHSSGPRGLALAPVWAYLRCEADGADTLIVNTFEQSSASLTLGGERVSVEQRSGFPLRGGARLVFHLARPARFALKVRQPEWATRMHIDGAVSRDGWIELPARLWTDGDAVTIQYTLGARIIVGDRHNEGRAAFAYGPFVLAYDEGANANLSAAHSLGFAARPAVRLVSSSDETPRFEARLRARPTPVTLRTFADAGSGGDAIRTWLWAPGLSERPPADSLLLDGAPSVSRGAGERPLLNDDDVERAFGISTLDSSAAEQDWFAVELPAPASARRFVFVHGVVTREGGWFDARGGKPLVQIREDSASQWLTIGELADYPSTTDVDPVGTDNAWHHHGYSLALAAPRRFTAVRVIGRPAAGADAARPYVTCAELQAFQV